MSGREKSAPAAEGTPRPNSRRTREAERQTIAAGVDAAVWKERALVLEAFLFEHADREHAMHTADADPAVCGCRSCCTQLLVKIRDEHPVE
jgi:hypothetical protein